MCILFSDPLIFSYYYHTARRHFDKCRIVCICGLFLLYFWKQPESSTDEHVNLAVEKAQSAETYSVHFQEVAPALPG